MKDIEVVVLNEAHSNPAGMQLFLAKLTQRGHVIKNAKDLLAEYQECVGKVREPSAICKLANLPHGTIKRFAPITIAIVGASRRFLAQARTNQVGIDYVSGSLQYSDYSEKAQFVVPYPILEREAHWRKSFPIPTDMQLRCGSPVRRYLSACEDAMDAYADIAKYTDNDTAGYVAPQGLRNILIMQGNHQSWDYFIRLRSCNRNTIETQYVTILLWKALLATQDGESLFSKAGPDCIYGACREGSMSCGRPLHNSHVNEYMQKYGCSLPEAIISTNWLLLSQEVY